MCVGHQSGDRAELIVFSAIGMPPARFAALLRPPKVPHGWGSCAIASVRSVAKSASRFSRWIPTPNRHRRACKR